MHSFSGVVIFASLLSVTSAASPQLNRVALPKRPATQSQAAHTHVLSLQRQKANGVSKSYLRELAVVAGQEPLQNLDGVEFLANISFGGQSFKAIVDTGSADTWVAQTGFSCLDPTSGARASEAACAFPQTYAPSSTLQRVPDTSFNISYGSGEFLTGYMALEDVSFGGITVNQQQVGVVTSAGWTGDGVASGLIGLAYPALTSAFESGAAASDGTRDQVQYSPLFTTMADRGQVDSVFSMAISRDESKTGDGGLIALGGVIDPADVPGGYTPEFVSTPIEALQLQYGGRRTASYTFYAISLDGISFSQNSVSGSGSNAGAESAATEDRDQSSPFSSFSELWNWLFGFSQSDATSASPSSSSSSSSSPSPSDSESSSSPFDIEKRRFYRPPPHTPRSSLPHVIARQTNGTNTPPGPSTPFTGADPATVDLQVIVDSGTTLNYLPTSTATNFNSRFSPPGFTSNDPSLAGLWLVSCTATPPPLIYSINGETFETNPLDLILDLGDASNPGQTCVSGIQDGGEIGSGSVFILGDVFMKNVITVFDLGAGQMQFARRVEYPS